MLLVASYVFYGWWDYRFLSLILISTGVDFWAGKALEASSDDRRRKLIVTISIAMNLGLLGFFKYFNFFIDGAEQMLGGLGWSLNTWHLNIVLPVGISFYTFQTMSYTIDVYRRRMLATHNLLNFAVFVAFFPQLVAGPIERASHLLPQVEKVRRVTSNDWVVGGWLILWGLFKKVVIADNLAVITQEIFMGQADLGAGTVLLGLYAFAFQIYGDFSGYSDIARGVSKWMGFDIMVNFRNPYFALNPQEFWHRWHISLSTWLKDYLYIPLGGSRKGPRRTYINLGLTMLLGGLWHGAAWTFVAWGAYQGALLMGHRAVVGKHAATPTSVPGWLWLLKVVGMFHLACLGWLLFRAESMGQVAEFLIVLVSDFRLGAEWSRYALWMVVVCTPLFFVQILQEWSGDLLAPLRLSLLPRVALIATCLVMLIGIGHTGGQTFIYFQF